MIPLAPDSHLLLIHIKCVAMVQRRPAGSLLPVGKIQSAGADVFIVTHVLLPVTASGDESQSHSRVRDGSELGGKAAITHIAIKSLRYLEGSYCRLSEILN